MLTCLNELSVSQLEDIERLLLKCKQHDGNTIPIYKHLIEKRHPIPCNILYYQNNQLAGYLRSFFFFEDACEVTLMVDPKLRRKRIATQLLETIIPIMQSEYINKLIFSTPPKIHDAWFKELGLTYRNSEYHMQYRLKNQSTIKAKPAKIRFATTEDIPDLCIIDNFAFPNKKAEPEALFHSLLKTHNCEIFVLTVDNKVIGKAHIFTESDKVRLTDIGIHPDCRSQGFGTSLIKHCINHCLLRNKTNIVLDVETSNDGALKLYQNLGFEITNSHDYWFTPPNQENYGLNAIIQNHS